VATDAVDTRSVWIHGHEVSYRVCGDPADGRPVILLVHGMAGSSSTWRGVMPALAEHATVLAPDLMGHGRSAKPLHDYSLGAFASMLRDFLVALGVERATLVGQSLGGGIAMQLAYQYPERCERLVLVGSGGLGRDVSLILRALTLPGAELLMPLLFPSFVRDAGNAISRRLFSLGLRAPRLEEEWRAYVSLVDPETRAAFVRTSRAVIDFGGQTVSAHDRLYLAAQVPTLIVWGENDHIIPVSHAHAAHEAMPGSRLEIFEHCGHFPHSEDPTRFAEVLLRFLDETEPLELDEASWRAMITANADAPATS
jgi:pimeloyl-ACP methyl ester carboxylesterase